MQSTSTVSNVTSGKAPYALGVEEDIEHETIAPDTSRILELSWNETPVDLRPEYHPRSMKASHEVLMEGNTSGESCARWQFIRSVEEHYDFSMSYLTEETNVTVHHGADLNVFVGPLGFVTGEEYDKQTHLGELSAWHCSTAFLPSQGITIKWEPKHGTKPPLDVKQAAGQSSA
jgi:hypothetical protein